MPLCKLGVILQMDCGRELTLWCYIWKTKEDFCLNLFQSNSLKYVNVRPHKYSNYVSVQQRESNRLKTVFVKWQG